MGGDVVMGVHAIGYGVLRGTLGVSGVLCVRLQQELARCCE